MIFLPHNATKLSLGILKALLEWLWWAWLLVYDDSGPEKLLKILCGLLKRLLLSVYRLIEATTFPTDISIIPHLVVRCTHRYGCLIPLVDHRQNLLLTVRVLDVILLLLDLFVLDWSCWTKDSRRQFSWSTVCWWAISIDMKQLLVTLLRRFTKLCHAITAWD